MTHPLPLLLVLWPLVGGLVIALFGRRGDRVRHATALVVTATSLLGVVALVPLVVREGYLISNIPALIGRISFYVDAFGLLFALLTSFVWLCSTLHALDYLRHDGHGTRYHAVSLLVLGAMLGVVLAGDLVTLYLSFEILGLLGFVLVIHEQTPAARKAALTYLWMTVAGSGALLAGIFLAYGVGGSINIGPLPLTADAPPTIWVAFGLMLLGFGVKAGMVPVHGWLPGAHAAAPSPASALLSGVMIKAGAYGIFRIITALFRPDLGEGWPGADFGLIVLWLGMVTMLLGVVMALRQHDAKRLLAYHSVSQMGFVLAGLGAGGYLGVEGAQGQAGGLLHVVNHGLFKAALFLGVGAVAFRTGERDLYKLGGLWRQMPVTFVFMLIAAAGIAGVPLFNGFVSKSLIHHALVEAYPELPGRLTEALFMITAGGTMASFIKLIALTFFGKPKRPAVREAPVGMLLGMGLLAFPIIALGLRPDPALRGIIAPGLSAWGISADGVEVFLTRYFLSTGDLAAAALVAVLGVLIYLVGIRGGLLTRAWPAPARWWANIGTVARSIATEWQRYTPAWSPAMSQSTRRLKAPPLGRLEQLLMRWDRAGALWLLLGLLLAWSMLKGGAGG